MLKTKQQRGTLQSQVKHRCQVVGGEGSRNPYGRFESTYCDPSDIPPISLLGQVFKPEIAYGFYI